LVLALFACTPPVSLQAQRAAQDSLTWLRGNLHVHTNRSDGDSPPSIVIRWYQEHGYQFVAITDHNTLTAAADSSCPGFLVLPGIEVTDRVEGRPVHLNGIGVTRPIQPQGGSNVTSVIERNSVAIRGAGGLPILNHPNGLLRAYLKSEEIRGARSVSLFEVCCADYRGGSGVPSTDALWDSLLSSGRRLFAIAGNDAHIFQGESRQPGSAWVMVRAASLGGDAILQAIANGAFYTTTGTEILAVIYTFDTLSLQLPFSDGYGYRTFFIGRGGKVLAVDESRAPRYALRSDEDYVRARVERSDGTIAWVQPLFGPRYLDQH